MRDIIEESKNLLNKTKTKQQKTLNFTFKILMFGKKINKTKKFVPKNRRMHFYWFLTKDRIIC